MNSASYDRHHPFVSRIKERYVLNRSGASRETWHFVLDLSGSNIRYLPGDSIGIIPYNDPQKVERILKALALSGDEEVEDSKANKLSIRKFLLGRANLSHAPKKLVVELMQQQPDLLKKATLQNLLCEGNEESLHQYTASFDVAELIEEYKEANLSPQPLTKLLQPLLPRLYSIASSQSVVPDEVHLTVARVHYNVHGKERRGICSHFLCDLVKTGEHAVPVYLQPTRDFRLPDAGSVPIIMVGPGTGVAPFRAFMQERAFRKGPCNKSWLFFGERSVQTDFFYEEFWKSLVQADILRLDVAFSRDQQEKIYVQNRMWENRKELWHWIEDGAVIYVCGDSQRMAKDVDHCLQRIVQEEGGLSEEEMKNFMKKLRADKRYLRDVY